MKPANPISIKLLNKQYQVNCPIGKEESLQDAANYLDTKLREIYEQGKNLSIDRIALMAALNLCHELLLFRQQKEHYVQSISEQIERLQNKLDEALMNEPGLNT